MCVCTRLAISAAVAGAGPPVAATSGNGTRGTFDTTVALPGHEGVVTVVAYEASAKAGPPLHVVRVPLVLSG